MLSLDKSVAAPAAPSVWAGEASTRQLLAPEGELLLA